MQTCNKLAIMIACLLQVSLKLAANLQSRLQVCCKFATNLQGLFCKKEKFFKKISKFLQKNRIFF